MTIKTALMVVVGTFLFVLIFISGLYLGRKQQISSAPNFQAGTLPNRAEPQIQSYQSATSNSEEGTKEAALTSQADPIRPDTSKLDDLVAKYNINLQQLDQLYQQVDRLADQKATAEPSVSTILADKIIKLLDEINVLVKTVVSQHNAILADPDHNIYYREGLYTASHGRVGTKWADFHFFEHK